MRFRVQGLGLGHDQGSASRSRPGPPELTLSPGGGTLPEASMGTGWESSPNHGPPFLSTWVLDFLEVCEAGCLLDVMLQGYLSGGWRCSVRRRLLSFILIRPLCCCIHAFHPAQQLRAQQATTDLTSHGRRSKDPKP